MVKLTDYNPLENVFRSRNRFVFNMLGRYLENISINTFKLEICTKIQQNWDLEIVIPAEAGIQDINRMQLLFGEMTNNYFNVGC